MTLNKEELVSILSDYFKISRVSVLLFMDLMESLIRNFKENRFDLKPEGHYSGIKEKIPKKLENNSYLTPKPHSKKIVLKPTPTPAAAPQSLRVKKISDLDLMEIFKILREEDKIGKKHSSIELSKIVQGYSSYQYACATYRYNLKKKEIKLKNLPDGWECMAWAQKEKTIGTLEDTAIIMAINDYEPSLSLKKTCMDRLLLLKVVVPPKESWVEKTQK